MPRGARPKSFEFNHLRNQWRASLKNTPVKMLIWLKKRAISPIQIKTTSVVRGTAPGPHARTKSTPAQPNHYTVRWNISHASSAWLKGSSMTNAMDSSAMDVLPVTPPRVAVQMAQIVKEPKTN